MQSMRNQRLQSMQACRAVAAISVLLYHMTDQGQKQFGYTLANGAFLFGYTGVDFFFVLSGFIIFFAHARDIGKGDALGSYAVRRFIRIFPFFWAVLLLKLLSLAVLPGQVSASSSGTGYIVRSALLIPQTSLPFLAPAWTLSYELLFYILFGVGIWLGRRIMVIGAMLWSGLILLYAFDARTDFAHVYPSFWFGFLLNERNLEFLFGCVVGVIVLTYKVGRAWLWLAGTTGIAYFLACAVNVNGQQGGEPPSFATTFGIASFLIVLGFAGLDLQSRFRLPKVLVFFGDASYSVYMTQLIFLNLYFVIIRSTANVDVLHPAWLLGFGVIFVLVGGGMCHVLVERPLLRALRRVFLGITSPTSFQPKPTTSPRRHGPIT